MDQFGYHEMRKALQQIGYLCTSTEALKQPIKSFGDDILASVRRGLTTSAPDQAGRRCPYCGSPLGNDDTTRDGEALWCADCGMRVEYFDALSEAEECRS